MTSDTFSGGQPLRLRTALIAAAATATTLALFTATPAGAQEGAIRGAGAPGAIAERYIVVLKNEANAAVDSAASQLAAAYGGQVRFTYTHALQGFSVTMTEKRARRLAANPRVDFVEQVGTASIADTQSNPPWGLDRVDQRDLPLNQSYTYPGDGGSGVTVYVLDTGARMTHQQFTGRISAGPDYIDNDSNPADCNGHGTHVAGTAAGSTYGVAKRARIVPVRVLDCNGSGGWDVILRGVDWVTANAVKPAVANMSLGGTGTQSSLEAAVRRSISSGVTYALAGGNNGSDACGFTPARVAEAITVGNSTSTDTRSSTSNFGTCLDIWAPGTSILSSYYTSDTATSTLTGTSMASPHVAGAAALYLAQNTSATPAQVRSALVSNGSTGKLTGIGSGSPNVLLYTGFLNGGTPSPGGCSGHEFTVNGTLASATSQIQPTSGYYYSALSGTHRANLCGPTGTDFDLYLQKWNGSAWVSVASATTPSNTESITYTGTAGYYRYRVLAYSGSGSYTLGYTNP